MKVQKLFAISTILAILSFLTQLQLMATVFTYTDVSAWEAAVGSFVTEPFDSSGLQPFTGVASSVGHIGPAHGVLSGSVWEDNISSTAFTFTTFSYLTSPLFGAGAFWDTSVNGEGAGIGITLNEAGGGETAAFISGVDGNFVGWLSTTPFNSFLIYGRPVGPLGGGETFEMDNLVFAPVPEPSRLAVLILGFVVLMACPPRRKACPPVAKETP